MKKIIIPTRCTEHAVNLFRLATRLYSNEGFHCTFLQVVPIPDNEGDLMMHWADKHRRIYVFSR